MQIRLHGALVLFAFSFCFLPFFSHADVNDIDLKKFVRIDTKKPADASGNFYCTSDCQDGDFQAQNYFQVMTSELAFVLSPRVLSPAKTLGFGGFEISFLTSFHLIHNQEPYWNVTEQGNPTGGLQSVHFQARKGLPLGFEISTNVGQILSSNMYAIGGGLKLALSEGYVVIPDFSTGISINRLLGSRDLDMTMGSIDFIASKAFGIQAMTTVTPHLGYSLLMTNIASHIIDPTPASIGIEQASRNVVFEEQQILDNKAHKIIIGTTATMFIFSLAAEWSYYIGKSVTYTSPTDGSSAVYSPNMQTFSLKLSVGF